MRRWGVVAPMSFSSRPASCFAADSSVRTALRLTRREVRRLERACVLVVLGLRLGVRRGFGGIVGRPFAWSRSRLRRARASSPKGRVFVLGSRARAYGRIDAFGSLSAGRRPANWSSVQYTVISPTSPPARCTTDTSPTLRYLPRFLWFWERCLLVTAPFSTPPRAPSRPPWPCSARCSRCSRFWRSSDPRRSSRRRLPRPPAATPASATSPSIAASSPRAATRCVRLAAAKARAPLRVRVTPFPALGAIAAVREPPLARRAAARSSTVRDRRLHPPAHDDVPSGWCS